MDATRSIDTGPRGRAARHEPRMDPPPVIGRDERRMHVRAYNFWVSLLGGRQLPALDGFDPAEISDFGDHGVLLDFTAGAADPRVRFLGDALRAEAAITGEVARVSAISEGTLVTRLIGSYPQIVINHAPVGFEAEFTNVRGNPTLYRGILLPFSSDGGTIDHVYGVINWKEMASTTDAALLASQVRAAIQETGPRTAAAGRGAATPWADGPSLRLLTPEPEAVDAATPQPPAPIEEPAAPGCSGALANHLAAARGTIDQLHAADLRARSALYRALGLAYDFSCSACADPQDLADMMAASGMRRRKRASMVEIVQLIFGAEQDRKRLAGFAIVLAHGHRLKLPSGGLRRLLESSENGLQSIVAAERAARRAAAQARAKTSPARRPRTAKPRAMKRSAG